MSKTEKLTDAQQRALSLLSRDKWIFPPIGKHRTFQALEDAGHAEGKLMLARHDYVRGSADFKRAYRLRSDV